MGKVYETDGEKIFYNQKETGSICAIHESYIVKTSYHDDECEEFYYIYKSLFGLNQSEMELTRNQEDKWIPKLYKELSDRANEVDSLIVDYEDKKNPPLKESFRLNKIISISINLF